MFNNLSALYLLNQDARMQLASGTTGVEVLNKEVNSRFKNVQQLYQSTLVMDCFAFGFMKLLIHNCGEYMPPGHQAPQHMFVSHNLSCWRFSASEWKTILPSREMPLPALRADHKSRVQKHKEAVKKRPVSSQKRRRAGGIKRHTFNKKRV